MTERRGNRRKWSRGSLKNTGNEFKRKPNREFANIVQLTEEEVGINEFIGKHEGFSGIIKARYSDFHVNEINLDGNMAKLTNVSIPKEFTDPIRPTDLDAIVCPSQFISSEMWTKILEIAKGTLNESVKLNTTGLNKEERSEIHLQVKNCLGNLINASTLTESNEKFIEFKKQTSKDDNRVRWPPNLGEFVHFVVYKEAIDTMDASLRISSCLKMKSNNFNYAGVKDRRAKTTQWFSARKLHPQQLITKTTCLKNIHISNFTFKDSPLKLGQLKANHFRIALRNVLASDDVIAHSIESLKLNGFINYYGLQRFGNDKEVPTFLIGVKLLLGNWKEAVDLILKLKSGDDPLMGITKAKKIYLETSDAQKAVKELKPRDFSTIEGKLLHGLSKNHRNDYVNSLENIPRNTRLMYIHAFQSFVWNKVVTKRIQQFGLKVVEGDLISLKDVEEDEENQIKVLTKDDLSNYSIFDVVLPLPGYDIIYPDNEIKDAYKSLLEAHALTLEMSKGSVKTYRLSGTYRKMIVKPEDLSWSIVRYNEPNDNLIQSDYEELKKIQMPVNTPDGKFKAVLMNFTLKSSSYATMALREALKIDTCVSSHAKLNNYFESKQTEATTSKIIEESTLLDDKEKMKQFQNLIFQDKEENDEPLEKKLKIV